MKPKVEFDVDASDAIEMVDEMVQSEDATVSIELDLKTISELKLRWLKNEGRDFLKVNKNLEQLVLSFIDSGTLEDSTFAAGAEQELKDYLVSRITNPDVPVKPLKPSTIKAKMKKGYPLKPGVATQDLLDDIKGSNLSLKINFGSNRKKVKTP